MLFYDKHISSYQNIINKINDEIDYCIEKFGDEEKTSHFSPTQKVNKDIGDILDQYTKTTIKPTSAEIDVILKNLAFEFVPIKNFRLKNQIESKKELLTKCIYPWAIRDLNKHIKILDSIIDDINLSHSKYQKKDIDALIILTVPVEFRAMFRKLSIITKAESNTFFNVLDPENDNKIKKRKDFWIEGIITKKDKWVKVVLQFPENYGSIKSSSNTFRTTDAIGSFSEALLVGVAGQMSEKNDVKVGDLIVSSGFYDAYNQRLKTKISYSNKTSIPLVNDFSKYFPVLNDWRPTGLVERKPKVKDNLTERTGFSHILEGLFVSGPPVVKNKAQKLNILKHFKNSKAVEMEASGCYEALKKFNTNFSIIKSVCDLSNKDKTKLWQPFCSDLAAEFTVDYLIAKYGKPII